MKTTSLAYSFFYDLANHSFESAGKASFNQSEFSKLNIAALRSKFTTGLAQGLDGSWDSNPDIARQHNFAFKDQNNCVVNDYIISDGSLRSLNARLYGTTSSNIQAVIPFIQSTGEELIYTDQTYKSVMRGLALEEGDQITFVLCSVDDNFDLLNPSPTFRQGTYAELNYYRVIFQPYTSQGVIADLEEAFINETGMVDGYSTVNLPNPKNRTEGFKVGIVAANTEMPYGGLCFYSEDQALIAGTHNTTMGVAAILTRRVGDTYKHSTETLWNRSDASELPDSIYNTELLHKDLYMGQAIDSYSTDVYSPLYLNQATWM